MLADTLEHIEQIIVGVDVVQAARYNQGLDHADVFGADFGPAEIPIFPAHWNDAQGALQMVCVGWYIGIVEEHFESGAPLACIGHRLGQWTAGQESLMVELNTNPIQTKNCVTKGRACAIR